MAYPTLQEVRQANAAVNDDGYALLTLSRPLGPYLAWIAIRMRTTPRQVNYLSLALVFVILALAAAGGRGGLIAATGLVFIWQLVDVTDGTMARALAIRDNFGGFVDYATGMVIAAFLPLCLGVGAYLTPDRSAGDLFALFGLDTGHASTAVLIAGAGVSVIVMYMRLINRVLFIRFGDSAIDAAEIKASEQRRGIAYLLTKNVETLGGIQAFAYFSAVAFGLLDALIVLYFVFYLCLLAAFAVSVYRNYGDRTAYLG